MSMTPTWQTYIMRVMVNNYNPEYAYIDNLGFKLTEQDLRNIKMHGKHEINGVLFHYLKPNIIIYLGGYKYTVATYDDISNNFYLYKFRDSLTVDLVKV